MAGFDRQSQKRIAAVVRQVERSGTRPPRPRRNPALQGSNSRYFWRVNSLRTNKAYYNCQRVTFDSTDFDTGNTDPRIFTGSDDIVFNLYEGGTTTTHGLAVGDFLYGFSSTDDEGKDIFVGWPMAPIIKRATTITPASTGLTILVRLQDASGTAIGPFFTVAFLAPDGATDLISCLPRIAANTTILVSKIDGTWYAVYPTITKSSVCV